MFSHAGAEIFGWRCGLWKLLSRPSRLFAESSFPTDDFADKERSDDDIQSFVEVRSQTDLIFQLTKRVIDLMHHFIFLFPFLRIMDKLAIEEDRLDERGSATHSSEISQQEPDLARELPRRLRELLVKTQPVVESLFENSGFGFTFGDFLPLPPNNAAHTYTMAYLLTWKLILRFISGTRSELRPRFDHSYQSTFV